MGNELSSLQRNILAWVLSTVTLILVAVVGFTIREIAELQKSLPEKYVLLEQYRHDQHLVVEMDQKIDRLLLRDKR